MIVLVNPFLIENGADDDDVVQVVRVDELAEALGAGRGRAAVIVVVGFSSEGYDCLEIVQWLADNAPAVRVVLAHMEEPWAIPFILEARQILQGAGPETIVYAAWEATPAGPARATGSREERKKPRSRRPQSRWAEVLATVRSNSRLEPLTRDEDHDRAALVVSYLTSTATPAARCTRPSGW